METARIGVKFCGGCNPGYDRRAAYESVCDYVRARAAKERVEVNFERAEAGVPYDALLVICGCANRCANVSEYRSNAPPVYIWREIGIRDAGALLADYICHMVEV
jgi:hypothetical protein